MKDIGIFGLGLIGSALARRLVDGGHSVVGNDPSPEAARAFSETGGKAGTVENVWKADVVLSAVFDTDQLATLINGAPDGTETVLISTSTCDPERMPQLERQASEKGITLIEAPLSGTSKDLADGRAVFLLGGDAETCQNHAALFDILGRGHFYMGAIGQGNRAKLAINLVLGLNRAALAEGLVFAEALGLQTDSFLTLLQDSAAASKVMGSKGPMMVARNFEPLGRISQTAKDFSLIRNAAAEQKQPLPLAETYQRLVDQLVEDGDGDLDNSAILLAIERASKV